MRIFILGSSGFIGKNLVQSLSQHELFLYRRDDDIESAVKLFRPDLIYHLAGETRDESKMMQTNVELTRALLEASNDIPYRAFVYVGSSSEYGIKDEPMREDMECFPLTVYGQTKNVATELCKYHSMMFNKNIMIVRPFSVYGTGERSDRFFPAAINACLEGKPFECWAGNHDWVHVEDFVLALMSLPYKALPGEIINIGTGVMTSNLEVIRLIEKIVGKKVKGKYHRKQKRATDSKVWVADISKALALGWKPTVSLEEGLRRKIDELTATR